MFLPSSMVSTVMQRKEADRIVGHSTTIWASDLMPGYTPYLTRYVLVTITVSFFVLSFFFLFL